MNITRVQLDNFRSWGSLDLAIEPGVCLLSGANGAGKSSVVDACLFAMFGATSGAEALIRRGTDEARVVVEIQTEDGPISIGRSIRRSGNSAKVSLRAARETADGFTDEITAATVTETQLILDGLLGVSREVLQASAFSTQHGGGAFTEAAPRDRKRVFAEILALGFWDELAADAKAEKRAADDAANVARAELERLDGAGERHAAAVSHLADALNERDNAEANEQAADRRAAELAAEAEAAREARRQHAAAVEAEARARADHERAGVERTAADEALARAKAAAANAPSVEAARSDAHDADVQLGNIEAEQTALREASTKWREQFDEAERELRVCGDGRDEIALRMMRLRERLATASGDVCPECHQDLVTAEAKAMPARMRQEIADATEQLASCDEGVEIWKARADYLTKNAPIAPDDAKLRIFQRRVQDAQTALARAESVQSVAGSIDAAQSRARDAFERERQTRESVDRADDEMRALEAVKPIDDAPEQRHAAAAQAFATARAAHSAAAAELARAEETAKVAERQALDATAARERLTAAELDAAIAGILTAGFGPQGVPAMIVDGILGDLADEANRVLAELASPIRVDLRSQRLTQKGDVVDALDIVVQMDAMEAPYETLSGGERTRVQLALRAALTRLLASKRGARVRLLVVDEPAGLDSTGAEHLAAVLNEFVAAGVFDTVLLVTHHDALADLIGRVVRIEKNAGGESRLVEAPEGSPRPQLPSGDPSDAERIAS